MEKYLRRCLDSLIVSNELMPLLDVLIINDGSKDSSSQIAHEYELRFPNTFKVIDKVNGNYGSCVNRGIKEASGKYFRILDADDFFDTNSLISLIEKIVSFNEEPDLIITNYQEDYVNGYSRYIINEQYKYDILYDSENVFLGKQKNGYLSAMHRMTYKLDVIKKSGLKHTEGISYTDTEYCFYPLREVKTILFLNITLYHYQIGRDGQTVSVASYQKNIHSLYMIIDRMLTSFSCEDVNASYYPNLINVLSMILFTYYKVILTSKFEHSEDIKALDLRIYDFDISLYNYLASQKYAHLIPFIALWRKGFKTNGCVFTCAYKLIDGLLLLYRYCRRLFKRQ